MLFFVNRYQKPKTVTNYEVASTIESVNNEEHSEIPNRLWKILLMALCLSAYGATEISYFYFSSTMFQYLEPLRFSAEQAAHIMSILSAAYTIGRLLTAFISMKISPDVIISYHYIIIAASFVFLYVFRAERIFIYIGTVFLGESFFLFAFCSLILSLLICVTIHAYFLSYFRH